MGAGVNAFLKKIMASAVLCAPFLSHAVTKAEIDHYGYLTGYSGPIGIVHTTTLTPATGEFWAETEAPWPGYSFDQIFFSYYDKDYWERPWWFDGPRSFDVTFSTKFGAGETLKVGTYDNAYRFPGSSTPGLEVSYHSSGYDQNGGSYQIYDLSRDPQGKVISFAASFYLNNYGIPFGGRIWYNSDVDFSAVPEGSSTSLVFAGIATLVVLCRRKNAST